MNGFDDDLRASVSASASFGPAEVAERVARRGRTRRIAAAAGVTVIAAVGAASLVTVIGGDGPDVDVANPPTTDPTVPSTTITAGPVTEDPAGVDGETGVMSDFHVETTETFGFVQCGADGEPGPPNADRAAALDAVVEALRADGLHDQPFVWSSGGPQSIWGVISIGLSSRYEPTLQWLADQVDPADACIEFPQFGVRNLPPELAPVTIDFDAEAGEVTVTAEGCAPKGEWVEPFILNRTGAAEVGIAIGRGGLAFTDDCPAPTPHIFELLNKAAVTIAAAPGTLTFEAPVAPGARVGFTFDRVNVASDTTMGDDLIAQYADDPTVQFQVSDIFSGAPVAGTVGEVATDQWPITGAGAIVVPEGVPAGTYHVRSIAHPELNGSLVVAAGGCGQPPGGPDTGWILPDLNDDCVVEVADSSTGVVFISDGDEYRTLLDEDGAAVVLPIDGSMSFACHHEWGQVTRYRDADADGSAAPGEFDDLVVIGEVGGWSPSVADVVGDTPLPGRGQDCVAFAKG